MSIRPAWWMTLQAFLVPGTSKLLKGSLTTVMGRLSSRITVPLLSGKNFNITYLPINQHIEGMENTLLPQSVLEEMVRSSAHRVIIKRCTCRDGQKCENHPIEMACLLLGEGTKEIDTGVSRHVSVDDALDHVRQCIENGLIPFVGRFKADNYLWGVKDRGKLLTVCFCCRCCCVLMNSARFMPQVTQDAFVKLKGLKIFTDQDLCTTCGTCVEECFMGSRSIKNSKIAYDADLCKGCGKCITACPGRAITARVADLNEAVAEVWNRVDLLIDYQ